jgi:hypothetical protein
VTRRRKEGFKGTKCIKGTNRIGKKIPRGAWMSVSCECCVLSGRDLCDGLITLPEESYRVCVSECDREASKMRRPWPTRAVEPLEEKKVFDE